MTDSDVFISSEKVAVSPRWSLDDIAYDEIDAGLIADDEELFFILAAASFIEIGTDLYTRNLVEFFAGDAEVSSWLREVWESEELQHGRALKAYVQRVWPAFDWAAAHADFLREYSGLCLVEELESTRALELAARCMVEMGTSSYYAAIRDHAREPVIRKLVNLIRADEIRHYKYFYRFFRRYNALEHNGRLSVFAAISRRIWELRNSDADCALWHIYHHRHPESSRQDAAYRDMVAAVARRVRQTFPAGMAVKMTLRPLALPATAQRVVEPLALATQRLLLR